MKSTITPDDRLRLIGLLTLARDLVAQQKAIENSAAKLLGLADENNDLDNPYYSHLSDAIYQGDSADIALGRLGINVADAADPKEPA